MSYTDLKKVLDPAFKRFTKADFLAYIAAVDGRTRVGGPKGKGRITAKRAAALLA